MPKIKFSNSFRLRVFYYLSDIHFTSLVVLLFFFFTISWSLDNSVHNESWISTNLTSLFA